MAEEHQPGVVADMGMGEENAVQHRTAGTGREGAVEAVKLLADIRRGVDQEALAGGVIHEAEAGGVAALRRVRPAGIIVMADLRRAAVLGRSEHDQRYVHERP